MVRVRGNSDSKKKVKNDKKKKKKKSYLPRVRVRGSCYSKKVIYKIN